MLYKVEWLDPGDGSYRGVVVTLYDDASLQSFYHALAYAEQMSEGGWYNVQIMGDAHGPEAREYTWLMR